MTRRRMRRRAAVENRLRWAKLGSRTGIDYVPDDYAAAAVSWAAFYFRCEVFVDGQICDAGLLDLFFTIVFCVQGSSPFV